jgi:hypothetical protein
MQLTAQRIALDLHEAGFAVQVSSFSTAQSQLALVKIPMQGSDPAAILEQMLRALGQSEPVTARLPEALYKTERDFLDRHTAIPLLDLPRAYATGPRVRDFHLRADGTPDLASTSLEGVQ